MAAAAAPAAEAARVAAAAVQAGGSGGTGSGGSGGGSTSGATPVVYLAEQDTVDIYELYMSTSTGSVKINGTLVPGGVV